MGLRQALARWFGRGDEQGERAELERLDRTAAELEAAESAADERVRIRQEAAWQTRIEALLEGLGEAEREQAAIGLRTLLAERDQAGGVSAGDGGVAMGTVRNHAEQGSIAAGVVFGRARIGHPPTPDPSQG
ncbi:hypothetical protein [Streptomyces sp. G45]|uniref:hypothetical protein n=1 Tax=Streptomyces sp. G45 TaxID=3406627 RepID=UPI003C163AF8